MEGRTFSVSRNDVRIARSLGNGIDDRVVVMNAFGNDDGYENEERWIADVNGDGSVDIVGFSDAGVVVSLGANECSDRLVKVTGSLGGETHITYAPTTDPEVYSGNLHSYPFAGLTVPLQVVKSYSMPDGVGGSQVVSMEYRNAKVDLQGRGLLGFQRIFQNDELSGAKTQRKLFHLFPKTGLVRWQMSFSPNGTLISRVDTAGPRARLIRA